MLKPHLDDAGRHESLQARRGLSVVKVRELLAARFPRPDAPSSIRKLPEKRETRVLHALNDAAACCTERLTLRRKLEQCRELMRHTNPSGDFAPIVERALDLLLDKLMRERFGAAQRPRTKSSTSSARRPDRATCRAVVARDGLRCSWLGDDGERCSATGWLQLDHERPFAKGASPPPAGAIPPRMPSPAPLGGSYSNRHRSARSHASDRSIPAVLQLIRDVADKDREPSHSRRGERRGSAARGDPRAAGDGGAGWLAWSAASGVCA